MQEISKDDLARLKTAYDAYVQLPLRSSRRLIKMKEYQNVLYELGGKYHMEADQLRVLAQIY